MKTTGKHLLFTIVFLSFLTLLPSISPAKGKGSTSLVNGYCCNKGLVFSASQLQCNQKGGHYYQTKAEALKYCKPKKVYCCANGKVNKNNSRTMQK